MDWLSLAQGNLSVPGWQQFLDKLVGEMDNLRAASTWLLEHNTEETLVLCAFLSYFWHNHRYHTEARNLLEKALALPRASSKPGLS